MKDLANGGFSHAQIYDALHGRSGTRQMKFRYDLIRDGVTIGQLPVISGSVRYRKEDSIRRTARFTLKEDNRINWLTDRIKPYMLLRMPDGVRQSARPLETWGNLAEYAWSGASQFLWGDFADGTAQGTARYERWVQFPLGVFIPSTPTRHFEAGAQYEVEAYDLSVILKEDCITDRTYFASGTKYLDAVQSLLVSAGIVQVMATESEAVMATDHEFEIGTSKLEIVNQLLMEINYNTFVIDADGIGILSPYEEPSGARVSLEYLQDQLSVICPQADTELDLYNVPNVFVAVVSNPDYSKDNTDFEYFRCEYVNDNPASALSTIKRGRRIVSVLKPNDIATLEDLQKYVRRQAFQASQVYETVQFSTALMPVHGENEVLRIQHPDIHGIYEETGWEMELSAGSQMTHEARRMMVI